MISIGIVGTGSIAGHFARSIAELPEANLSAVCSSSPERALEAHVRFGVPAYSELQTMLASEQLDMLCICTASGRHLESALAGASRGLHILCEKPLEINPARIDQMIAGCRQAGVLLGCIFQNRLSAGFRQLRSALDEGLLGRTLVINAFIPWYRSAQYYGSSHWRGTLDGDGGGALINQGIHTVDLMQLLGGPVANVMGYTGTILHQIEGEDLAQAIISFEGGASGLIQASTALWPGYPERLEVYGSRGSAVLEGGQIKAWHIDGHDHTQEYPAGSASGASDPMAIGHELHREQIGTFLASIRGEGTYEIDGAEARKSVALIDAIYRSATSSGATQPN